MNHPLMSALTGALTSAAMASALMLASAPAHAGKTLDSIRQKGQISCGVSTGVTGFSAPDSKGEWSGLDVDVCRAIAAAILSDPRKVRWVPLSPQQRFTALQSGEIDILSRNTSWTLTRDASLGAEFVAVTYYDGQGFIVPKKLNITSAKQLKNLQICVQTGTTTEKNLADYSRTEKLSIKPVVLERFDAAVAAYLSGRCQAYTTDVSGLASVRNKEVPNPDEHVILPEVISKEPLAPMVRRGDDEFTTIARWVIFALIEAEEYGITRANVESMRKNSDPNVQRILGQSEDMGKLLGLDKGWAARAIAAVGNYGEIFDRNVGKDSPLKLPRGPNQLWNKGGILFAPPIR